MQIRRKYSGDGRATVVQMLRKTLSRQCHRLTCKLSTLKAGEKCSLVIVGGMMNGSVSVQFNANSMQIGGVCTGIFSDHSW
jgi:hypothetical protein